MGGFRCVRGNNLLDGLNISVASCNNHRDIVRPEMIKFVATFRSDGFSYVPRASCSSRLTEA
jgi:hypothetical protein